MYGPFSKSIFPWGGNYDVYKTPPHPSSSFFHGKISKKQMKYSKIFSEPKTPKGGYIKGVKEEGGNEGGGYGSSHFST